MIEKGDQLDLYILNFGYRFVAVETLFRRQDADLSWNLDREGGKG